MSSVTSLLGGKASSIAKQVDGLAHETGESLHDVASSIRKRGKQGSRAIADLAEGTATKLDRAGSYIEKHDLKHAIGESRHLVRRYPVHFLAIAGCLGFVTGFAIRRLTHVCDRTVAPVSN
jgi:ElaB/YqjD/DUF883 family membrane-anchored ribosome-binding protein